MNIGDHAKAFFSDVGRVFDTKKPEVSKRFGESVTMRVAAVGLIAIAAAGAALAIVSGSVAVILPVLIGVGIAVIAGHDLFRVGTNMRQQTPEGLAAQGKNDAGKLGKNIDKALNADDLESMKKHGKKALKNAGNAVSNFFNGTAKIIEQKIEPSFKKDTAGTLLARHFSVFDQSK